jgi:C4-dicarboxylate-specific signal transduction histidine kinase
MKLTYRTAEFNQRYFEDTVSRSLKTVQSLSRTIDNFRLFSERCSENEQFNPAEIMERTLSLLATSLESNHIRTDFQVVGTFMLQGCASQFSLVLLNIINNALDAFATVRVADPRLCLRLVGGEGLTVVTVTDNAGGIPEGAREKMFEPYFSTKEATSGVGLGLFLCKTIVERTMNGKISARNLGAGAEIKIEFRSPGSPELPQSSGGLLTGGQALAR